MKSLLHSTSCQLHQAVAEKEKVVADSQQALVKLEELKYNAEVAQSSMASRLQGQEDTCMKTSGTLTALADAVERFQRHVLPTFKPLVPDNLKPTHTVSAELGPNQFMMNEVQTTYNITARILSCYQFGNGSSRWIQQLSRSLVSIGECKDIVTVLMCDTDDGSQQDCKLDFNYCE